MRLVFLLFVFIFLISYVSAGVGISWGAEEVGLIEGSKVCLNYGVYNPWNRDVDVKVSLVGDILNFSAGESVVYKKIVANTNSTEALIVPFCFEALDDNIGRKNCLIGNLMCKVDCSSEGFSVDGAVEVTDLSGGDLNGAKSGSDVFASVSAPLRLNVMCVDKKRDMSFLYGSVFVLSSILLALNIYFMRKGRRKRLFIGIGKRFNKRKVVFKKLNIF